MWSTELLLKALELWARNCLCQACTAWEYCRVAQSIVYVEDISTFGGYLDFSVVNPNQLLVLVSLYKTLQQPPPFPFYFLSFGFRTDLLSKALKHSCVVQTSTVQVLSIVNPLKSEQLQFTCIQYFSHLRRQNFQHEVKTGILLWFITWLLDR